MNVTDYCAELMKQEFNDSLGHNFIKVGFILFLQQKNFVFEKIEADALFLYTFRFLRDNERKVKNTSDVLVKNITHYSPLDLKTDFESSLNSWMKMGSGVLCYDGDYVFINPAMALEEKDIPVLKKVVEMMLVKNFGHSFEYSDSLLSEAAKIQPYICDFYLYQKAMTKSKFVSRAYESSDYCCCCESIDKNDLVPIHIDRNKDLSDPANLLLMCKEHAELYFYNYFSFNKSGRIIIKRNHPSLDKRMHLSIKVLTKERKKYLSE